MRHEGESRTLDPADSIPTGVAIDSLSKQVEEIVQLRVLDGLLTEIPFEVTFGDVGPVRRPVDQDVIPRPVFGRTGLRDLLVPRVRALKAFVRSDDHPSVVELAVVNYLPDGEDAQPRLTDRRQLQRVEGGRFRSWQD